MPQVRPGLDRRTGIVALAILVFALGGGVIGFGAGRRGSTALIVLGVALVVFGIAAVVVLLRRRFVGGPLAQEPPATRRAVQHAIRDGHTNDPRIEELARAVAARAPNPRMAYVGITVIWVLQLAVVLIDASRGGANRSDGTNVVGLVYLPLVVTFLWWQHRRLNRFR